MDAQQVPGNVIKRCVTKYGFLGAVVNDTQRDDASRGSPTFHDRHEWDMLWQICTKLDVLFYLHPRKPTGLFMEEIRALWKYFVGPHLSRTRGQVTSLWCGDQRRFDRHPKPQVIIGNLGEHIPFDVWGVNHWFEDGRKALGLE